MCVAAVALSLAILLLCFITPNKVYDDDDCNDSPSSVSSVTPNGSVFRL